MKPRQLRLGFVDRRPNLMAGINASMRPRQMRLGYSNRTESHNLRYARFNEAEATTPWKPWMVVQTW